MTSGESSACPCDDPGSADSRSRGHQVERVEFFLKCILNEGYVYGGKDGEQRDFIGFEGFKSCDIGNIHEPKLQGTDQCQFEIELPVYFGKLEERQEDQSAQ